jgi:SAM-dependent methyltransferase
MKKRFWNFRKNTKESGSGFVIKNTGHCPTCDQDVTFMARTEWLRDNYFCLNCGSIPRERALMLTIERYCPNWRSLTIHESSPGNRGASKRLSKESFRYIPSQYFPDKEPGSIVGKFRCENLESLTFADESIDLHVTQDVLEHIFHPSKVFKEIARTLKPGGFHICTVPLVNKDKPSKLRARINNNEIMYLEPEQYHGNPVGDGKSLVTVDWGFDICQHIFNACGLFTYLIQIDDLSSGIRAEYIEVLVTVKPSASDQKKETNGPD